MKRSIALTLALAFSIGFSRAQEIAEPESIHPWSAGITLDAGLELSAGVSLQRWIGKFGFGLTAVDVITDSLKLANGKGQLVSIAPMFSLSMDRLSPSLSRQAYLAIPLGIHTMYTSPAFFARLALGCEWTVADRMTTVFECGFRHDDPLRIPFKYGLSLMTSLSLRARF